MKTEVVLLAGFRSRLQVPFRRSALGVPGREFMINFAGIYCAMRDGQQPAQKLSQKMTVKWNCYVWQIFPKLLCKTGILNLISGFSSPSVWHILVQQSSSFSPFWQRNKIWLADTWILGQDLYYRQPSLCLTSKPLLVIAPLMILQGTSSTSLGFLKTNPCFLWKAFLAQMKERRRWKGRWCETSPARASRLQ